MEGIMRTKKRWYFVWMIVFVLLVFAGCEKKPIGTKGTDIVTKDVQKDYVEKALKEIMKTMRPDGQRSNEKKIQRSLAKHILKDHIALMAYFQSQQWEKMEKYLEQAIGDGKVKVYIKNDEDPVLEDPTAAFWAKLYGDKASKYLNQEVSIELEIYADDISLKDIKPIEGEEDCESTEFFKFKVIAVDKNGDVLSNQSGGGRRHSRPCPWI